MAARDVTAPASLNRLMVTRRLLPADALDRVIVVANLVESPLAWLARCKLLSARQVTAGERLRDDFVGAGHRPSVTMRWDASPVGRTARGSPPAHDPTITRIAARPRFDGAIAAAGPRLSDILWRVVCMSEGLETAERASNWPARAAKLVLCLALNGVLDYYIS